MTSDNKALPLRVAESQLMMSDKQVESGSRRDHIDSLTESAGRADSKKNTRLVSSSTSAMPNVMRHIFMERILDEKNYV